MILHFERGLENQIPEGMKDNVEIAKCMQGAVSIIRAYDTCNMDSEIREEAELAVSMACTMIFLMTGINKPSILEFLNELAGFTVEESQYIDLLERRFKI